MGNAFDPAGLRPLDVMLYRPSSLFGRFIRFHTGQNISHVEVYLGADAIRQVSPALLEQLDTTHDPLARYSTASRDGLGVNFYPTRTSELAYVLRPLTAGPLRVAAAVQKAIDLRGTPYGWIDLLDFFGYPINGKGIVCSPYAAIVLRAAGLPVFNTVQARTIAPYLFRTCELLYTVYTDGQDTALDAQPAV